MGVLSSLTGRAVRPDRRVLQRGRLGALVMVAGPRQTDGVDGLGEALGGRAFVDAGSVVTGRRSRGVPCGIGRLHRCSDLAVDGSRPRGGPREREADEVYVGPEPAAVKTADALGPA